MVTATDELGITARSICKKQGNKVFISMGVV